MQPWRADPTRDPERGAARPVGPRLLPVAALLLLLGCANEAGLPWGQLHAQAALRFDPPPGRLTPTGALKTANDERLSGLTLRARLAEVVVRTAPFDDGVAGFDPANPPAGYSLCHNGHCHAADGTLPTYQEIAATLGAAAATGPTLRWAATSPDAAYVASPEGAAMAVTACPACEVGRSRATLVEVHLRDLRVTGQAATLSDPLGPVDLLLPGEHVFTAVVDVPFTAGYAPIADLSVHVRLPATLFDDVRLADASAGGGVTLPASATTAVAARLREDTVVAVEVTRRWP